MSTVEARAYAADKPADNGGGQPAAKAPAGVAAVERAISIINAFQPGDVALSLHELAERTGLYKSTILRLIATLIGAHCMQRLDDGRYQLGSTLLHWGGLYQSSLRLEDHVVPTLRSLVQKTGEGASFFIRENDVRVCLFRVDSPHTVRDHVRVGDIVPLEKGAAGRVLLAFQSMDRAAIRAMADNLVIVTVGERETEIAAVAIPVFGYSNTLAGALALSGPVARFNAEVIETATRTLYEAAEQLTRKLGGDPTLYHSPDSLFLR